MLKERLMELATAPASGTLEAQVAWQSLELTSTIRRSRQIYVLGPSSPTTYLHTTVLLVWKMHIASATPVLLDNNGSDGSIATLIGGWAVFSRRPCAARATSGISPSLHGRIQAHASAVGIGTIPRCRTSISSNARLQRILSRTDISCIISRT
jgi:hypothetical protein